MIIVEKLITESANLSVNIKRGDPFLDGIIDSIIIDFELSIIKIILEDSEWDCHIIMLNNLDSFNLGGVETPKKSEVFPGVA